MNLHKTIYILVLTACCFSATLSFAATQSRASLNIEKSELSNSSKSLSVQLGYLKENDKSSVWRTWGFFVTGIEGEKSNSEKYDNQILAATTSFVFSQSYLELESAVSTNAIRSPELSLAAIYSYNFWQGPYELFTGLRHSQYQIDDYTAFTQGFRYYFGEYSYASAAADIPLSDVDLLTYKTNLTLNLNGTESVDLGYAFGEGLIDVGIKDRFTSGSIRASSDRTQIKWSLSASRYWGKFYSEDIIGAGAVWKF